MEKLTESKRQLVLLRGLLHQARQALSPFAEMAEGKEGWDADSSGGCAQFPSLKQVRAAATAVASIDAKEESPDLLPAVEAYIVAVRDFGRIKRKGTSTVNDIDAAEEDVFTTLSQLRKVARIVRQCREGAQ